MRTLRFLLLTCLLPMQAQPPFTAAPALDALIEQSIRQEEIPGAVLLVGQNGRILHRKAYGLRALVPTQEPMTVDTVFDAASLTKVVATTASLMKLFEEGKFRLSDKVVTYLPEFQNGKSDITVRQLLTHFSGMRPDVDLKPEWSGYDTGIRKALTDVPVNPPGTRFVYSDINFLLLGEMVQRLSGKSLADYARETIFLPLGMQDSLFQPPSSLLPRIAPTEQMPGMSEPLRGVVHDPTCRFMGGVAGHAGLFTTADDLARFAQMMLSNGRLGDTRLFSQLTVRKFTTPQTPLDQPILRGLGWDVDSPFSGNRGELYPIGSYGHTGFTGTSLWIDPQTQSYVVLLTNSVHPKLRPAVTGLRGRIATVVAAGLGTEVQGVLLSGYNELSTTGARRPVNRNGQTLNGLDVLAETRFAALQGKRVGLITNHTGITREGRRNIDVMLAAGVKLTALFSPEHGIAGKEDRENIGDSRDAASGVPVYSLYQGTRRPSEEALRNVDVLVFDIQDVGARFYTYMCTMAYALGEAARAGKPFLVLDRPNPITGTHVEGPMLDADLESFIGCAPVPVRHGMTLGEIARFLNTERQIKADLSVIPLRGWQRGDWFDATGLPWVNPSPNMRSLNAAVLYPGLALLEASTNYSVGRGTDSPFEQIGADWINGPQLAAALNARALPGVRVYPVEFQPNASNFNGKRISGVRFVITDREAVNAARVGMEVAATLQRLYPGKLDFTVDRKLMGSNDAVRGLAAGEEARLILLRQEEALRSFLERRTAYLLY